jgi:hypothetical protein
MLAFVLIVLSAVVALIVGLGMFKGVVTPERPWHEGDL